jgi:hypothetical protein
MKRTLAFALVALVGCSSSSTPTLTSDKCTSGTTAACDCGNGVMGTHSCIDGAYVSGCSCPGPGAPAK